MTSPFEVKKRSTRGAGSLMERPAGSNKWHLSYYVPEYDPVSGKTRSKRVKEYCGLPKAQAQKLLNDRVGKVARGEVLDVRPRTVAELYDALHTFTVNNSKPGRGCRADSLGWRWAHLAPFFAAMAAPAVTTAHVEKYKAERRKEGAAPATINRELAVLRRMFRHGRQCTPPLVHGVPSIRLFPEDNVRTGFVEQQQFDRLAEEAAKDGLWMRLFIEVAFTYGWRKGEVLGLRVRSVDLHHRAIRLDPGTTKNKEGREVAMTARVLELLREACSGKTAEDPVFTRDNGRPVRAFQNAWRSLCARAGLPGLMVHDLRRSAAKALRRAGVPESVIMATGGWKTASMFRRYAIVSSADQREAMQALEASRRKNSPNYGPTAAKGEKEVLSIQ